MSRNILPSAIEYLANTDKVRIAHLVELELPNSTKELPAYDYLTDYSTEVTWDGKVYSPDRVTKIGDVRQGTGLTNHKLAVSIAGEYQEELDRALNDNNQTSYVGKKLRVLRAYLTEEGGIIPFDKNTSGPMEYFFGLVSDIQINDGVVSGSSKVSWQCAGKFEDFNLINGRVTDDATHRGLETASNTNELLPGSGAKKEEYKTDTGFQHANQTISLISKYTTTEKRYKMKSSFLGLKSKLKEYEVEVEKELELGVDLAAKYLPFVRGVRRVPGVPVFLDNLKNNVSTLIVVYAICEGPASLLNLYIDGESTICSDEGQQETNMCLGSAKAGDTLSKYMRADGGYRNLYNSYAPKVPRYTRERDYINAYEPRYTPPIISKNNNLPAEKGLSDVTTFTVTNSTGTKRFTYHPGHHDQAANQTLVNLAASRRFFAQDAQGAGPEYWDSNSRLLDTAYLVLEMEITEEEQEIPELEMVVESHNYAGDEEVPSLNPADHLQDYITSKTFGGELDINELDLASFDYVRATYNKQLDSYDKSWAEYWRYLGWKDPETHVPKLLECNTLLKTDDTVTKNLESLLRQMDGTLNQLGGKYHLSIEDGSPAIADIHIDEVVGSVSVKDKSSDGKWNSISANLIDPALNWSTNKLVFFDSNYLTQDKEVPKKGNVTFNYITNYYVARNWAKRRLDRSRYAREVTFKTYFKYIYLYPNANVTFTYPRFNWDKKKLRVASMTMLADGMVSLTLRDTDDSIYSDIDDDKIIYPPDSGSNNLARPTGLQVVSPTDPAYNFPDIDNVYGFLIWDPYPDSNLLRYEVQDWRVPGELQVTIAVPTNRTITSVGGQDKVFHPITEVMPNVEYIFKVLNTDRFGNRSKYAITAKTFDVLDKPAAYSPVTGFVATNVDADGIYKGSAVTFEWDLHPSEEVQAYEIRLLDPDTENELGTTNIQATTQTECVYVFDIEENMAMYGDGNAGAIGAYRDYKAQIRAVATNGSSDWVSL